MSKLGRGRVLRIEAESPTYETRYFDPRGSIDQYYPLPSVPYLKLAAVHDADAKSLTLFALNRHLHEELPLDVKAEGFTGLAIDQALTLHDTDLKAVNTKDNPDRIRPTALKGVTANAGRIRASLPAASWTVIRLKDAG